MDDKSLFLFLGAIAEQQYRFRLLVKLLDEKKIISSDELESKFSDDEKFQFSHDLLNYLVSSGVQIPENLLSALSKESLSAGTLAVTESPDPGSEKKS